MMNAGLSLKVYMVTHGPECFEIPDYCVPIEVGAALRENFRYELRDDLTDDNVSLKNPTWSEVTAIYWMWKHDRSDIIGLFHYRRMYRLSEKQIIRFLGKADIIATYYDKEISVAEAFMQICPSGSLGTALRQIKENAPDYYDTALEVLHGKWYYCCNLFVTRRDLFDAYCQWLFPLVFQIEKEAERETVTDPRYIGYIVEMLLFNTYIRKNQLKVMHMNDCVFRGNRFVDKIVRSQLYGSPAFSWIKRRIPKKIRKKFVKSSN